jgi:hypothetical protein
LPCQTPTFVLCSWHRLRLGSVRFQERKGLGRVLILAPVKTRLRDLENNSVE